MKKNIFFIFNSFLVFVVFITCISCEKLSSIWSQQKVNNALFNQIEGMYSAYNKKELDNYCDYFTDGINVFKEQGLGNTRIISGKQDFRNYYQRIFKTKKLLRVTPLSQFEVYPWIMVKELIENEDQVFEAAVGYRLEGRKIRDRMILSENFLVNKEKLSIELPKQKQEGVPLVSPHLPKDNNSL